MALDAGLVIAVHAFMTQTPLLSSIALFLAAHLAYVLCALLVVVVIAGARTLKEKAETLIVVGAAGLIARFGAVELVRLFFYRPRPFLALGFEPLVSETSGSFPSGHATFFFAIGTALFCYDRKWGSVFLAAAAFVAFGRVAAGVHYPSDVLGGAVIGALVGWATYRAARFLLKKGNISTC